MEKFNKRQEIYNGYIVKLVKDEVILDDGSISYREVVKHNGGACIAIEDNEGKFLMVKQYRYAVEREMYEFCAGKLEPNEDPKNTAIREAVEETGYSVKDVVDFGYMVPTCGYCSELIYLYYAKLDKFLGQELDKDERIELHRFTLDEIHQMIKEGKIVDAKSICLAYHIERMRG